MKIERNHFASQPDFDIPKDGSMKKFKKLIKDSASFIEKSYNYYISEKNIKI